MGHDFDAVDADGEYRTGTTRICSGNWHDMWKIYKTGPYVWHAHSSEALLDNITQAIAHVEEQGCLIVDGQAMQLINSNFFWGLSADSCPAQDGERLSMFHAWLTRWQEIVVAAPGLFWYSDQVWDIEPYTMKNGIIDEGKERIEGVKKSENESEEDN